MKAPPFVVEVRISTGFYKPMGSGNDPVNSSNISAMDPNIDPRAMTISIFNVSGKQQDRVQVEYAMYKIDGSGQLQEMVKKSERISLATMERRNLLAQGALSLQPSAYTTVPRVEKFYGWYVKIFAEGQIVYEKFSPPELKTKLNIKQ